MKKLKDKFIKDFKEHFKSFAFASFFGAVVTLALFYITAPPTAPDKILHDLQKVIKSKLSKLESCSSRDISLRDNIVKTESLDIGTKNSVIIFGYWQGPDGGNEPRPCYIAIFEPESDSLIDKLTGRKSFYKLVSFDTIHEHADSIRAVLLEAEDFDQDGIKEIHIKLKFTWADSTSLAPLIYKRTDKSSWSLITLPSITESIRTTLEGKSRPPYLQPIMQPINKFTTGDEDPNDPRGFDLPPLDKLSVYEDRLTIHRDGQYVEFTSLRNGGDYFFRKHLRKGYFQVAIVAPLHDGNAVLSDHHCVVHFYRLENMSLKPDLFWNWGYPMFSYLPIRPSRIQIDEFCEAGISAHTSESGIFFGYTNFER